MSIFKNYTQITTTENRKKILEILSSGIAKVNPGDLIKKSVAYNKHFNSVVIASNNSYDLFRGRIFVIGAGKASGAMARAVEEIIGADNITAGIINCPQKNFKTKKIKINKAGHPLPNLSGVKGAEKMLDLKIKHKIGEKDLVLCLISGGASSLLPYPASGLSLKDKQEITDLLISSGADIGEINIVRKHLSLVKGGRLGEFFSPAKVVSLIISDVSGDKLDIIGSGPTVADPSSFKDAFEILKNYKLLQLVPKSVQVFLEKGMAGNFPETPKKIDNCDNYIIGSKTIALETMALKAKSLGKNPIIVTDKLYGDPEKAARFLAEEINSGVYKKYNVLLLGGETTPRLPIKHGQGGRNQHFTAAFIKYLNNFKSPWAFASMNTDGVDYLSETAGAMVDNFSLSQARTQGLNLEKYIKNYDTYNFFKTMGNNLLITGETGTNVGDIMLFLKD